MAVERYEAIENLRVTGNLLVEDSSGNPVTSDLGQADQNTMTYTVIAWSACPSSASQLAG